MKIIDLGRIDFEEGYDIQRSIVDNLIKGKTEDTLIICEHNPVITLGRSAKESNIIIEKPVLERCGIKVVYINRGGDVTYHGPGQIIGYPILDLKNIKKDIHFYLSMLENFIADFLNFFGLKSTRHLYGTGVWVNKSKIASIGIGIRHWITFHGFSINVKNIDGFSYINPCGIKKLEMTSIEKEVKKEVNFSYVKKMMAEKFPLFLSEIKNERYTLTPSCRGG